jgi:putative oxidoreductase
MFRSALERLDRIARASSLKFVPCSLASPVLKFLGKYREAGLLFLRASVGLIFILICGPVLLSGEHRWAQFGSAMRVFNFHSHLDWWGFLGALAGCVGGIFMMLGFAFRIGLLLALLPALVHAIAVSHHENGLYPVIIPIEAVIVLICLSFIGPGKYSVDKG